MLAHGWVFDGEIPLEVFTYPHVWEYIEGTYIYYRSPMSSYGWFVLVIDERRVPFWDYVPINKVPPKYRAMLLLLI